MNIYQPLYVYSFLIILFVLNVKSLFGLSFESLYNVLFDNNSNLNINNELLNKHIKLFLYLLLNGAKSIYMEKKIININKQINNIYTQSYNSEYNKNIFELYVTNIPIIVLSIYISIEMFFVFYAFNQIINQYHILIFLLINLTKFYNVYELCIYWNYLKQFNKMIL